MRLILLFLLITAQAANGQNEARVRQWVDSLCHPRYDGRGYVNKGDSRAADFIARQVKLINPELDVTFQPFNVGVNVFPDSLWLTVNGRRLSPGVDFLVNPKSQGCNGTFRLKKFKTKWAENETKLFNLGNSKKAERTFYIMPERKEPLAYQSLVGNVAKNPLHCAGYLVETSDKLTWAVGTMQLSTTVINLRPLARYGRKLQANVNQRFESNHTAKNAMVRLSGTGDGPRKVVVFTAHLDHLGRMGSQALMAGANDNASGSAMLLDLLQHFSENRPVFDCVFIWFAAEEAGLIGSRHYVQNPLFPLGDISFLINLDLMGDAKQGITVVNGKIYTQAYDALVAINTEHNLLPTLKARGEAANSDHHPFHEVGVPSFFIYTMGDYKHYHDVNDVPANLPFTHYKQVFELIERFAGQMAK